MDKSKGTPAADKKTYAEKAKAFLMKCYTTASTFKKVHKQTKEYIFMVLL